EQVSSRVEIRSHQGLFCRGEGVVEGALLAIEPDYRRIICQRHRTVNYGIVGCRFKHHSADVLAGDGAEAVVRAGWIFCGLELPTVLASHNQHARRAASLCSVDARTFALSAGSNHGDFVIPFRSGRQWAIGVTLHIRGEVDRRAKTYPVAAAIKIVAGANE